MLYTKFSSSYTRIDPDGTQHIFSKSMELIGRPTEITSFLNNIGPNYTLPGIGYKEDRQQIEVKRTGPFGIEMPEFLLDFLGY
ncbi:MAG: hypothetical protein R3F48_12735 [Candidatus Zixiibacteriota bacterium]